MQILRIILSVFFVLGALFKVDSQTIFSIDGKYGIIDERDNKTVIPPVYDEITACFHQDGFGIEDISHAFILRKNNKYFFVLNQFWKTGFTKSKDFSFNQRREQVDSVKWQLLEEEFDTIFPIQEMIKTRKESNFKNFEIYKEDTCLQNYTSTFTLAYRKNEKLGLLTYDRVSRVMQVQYDGDVVLLLGFTASAFLLSSLIQSSTAFRACKHRSLSRSSRIPSLAVL
jgi:hypothetical protein